MSDRYPIPAGTGRAELIEKNSRFIGFAGPAASDAEAEAFIRRASAEFPDAHHHVWAYLIGFGPAARYACHNDGEPGGTAGPPALAALQASGLGDVVVVVTRYFGGIKLGTGGLARAYGGVARAAVAALPRGERVLRCRLTVTLDYHYYDLFRRLLPPHEATIISTEYDNAVHFALEIPVDRRAEFLAAVRELTAGQADLS
jgi:uncharacterized YigZ family protein